MTKRRDNFIEFVYHTFNTIKDLILPLLSLVIAAIGTSNHFTPYIKFGFYTLIGFIIVFSFLKWYNKFFEFDGEKIRSSQGVFKKHLNEIPYNRIKSINISDSYLKRLFGICNFNVEVIGGNKVVFVLRKKYVDELRKTIFANEEITQEKVKTNKLSFKEYLLLSLTSPQLLLPALSLTFTMYSFVLSFLAPDESTDDSGMTPAKLKKYSTYFLEPEFLLSMAVFFAVILLTTYIFIFVYIFFVYGNFSVTSSAEGIRVKYGILKGKDYIIPKKQIRSLRIIQPFLFRRTGYVQLKVDNIGLNERSSSSVILNPIIKVEMIDSMLQKHLPLFSEQELHLKPEKKYIPNFLSYALYRNKFLIGSIVLGLVFSFKFFWLLGLFVPLSLIFGYCKWRHSSLGFNNDYISIRYTKRLKTITLITLKKYVETTSVIRPVLTKDKSINHYKFALYSEKLHETYTCKYLSGARKNEFSQYLSNK